MSLSGRAIVPLLSDVGDETGLRWSACVIDVDTAERLLETHPDRVLKTASVGKLFLLIEVARQAEAGMLAYESDGNVVRTLVHRAVLAELEA